MAKLLVVEDDKNLRDSVVSYLSFDHHIVEVAPNCTQALDKLAVSEFDALILDWELPDGTGIELLTQYRSRGGSSPILMLTGKSTISDKEVGFGAGADDYLTKPFNFKELTLRVNALLRRSPAVQSSILTARDIQLDSSSYRVTRDSMDLHLVPREFALLQFLMRNPNKVFSADALLNHVWESEIDASPAAVVACISRLRQKLERKGEPPLIRTVPGVGYKLEP